MKSSGYQWSCTSHPDLGSQARLAGTLFPRGRLVSGSGSWSPDLADLCVVTGQSPTLGSRDRCWFPLAPSSPSPGTLLRLCGLGSLLPRFPDIPSACSLPPFHGVLAQLCPVPKRPFPAIVFEVGTTKPFPGTWFSLVSLVGLSSTALTAIRFHKCLGHTPFCGGSLVCLNWCVSVLGIWCTLNTERTGFQATF